jgi:hypothetical protein
MVNLTLPPPLLPLTPDCECNQLLKDLSCVPWSSTQHIELAVCVGVTFGFGVAMASYFIKKYFQKQKIGVLQPIPETSVV